MRTCPRCALYPLLGGREDQAAPRRSREWPALCDPLGAGRHRAWRPQALWLRDPLHDQGRLAFLKHDWIARAGDFVYKTAGSSHAFQVEPGETTEAFIIVEGALEFIDEEGNTIAIEDWRTMYQRYLDYCEEEGLDPST